MSLPETFFILFGFFLAIPIILKWKNGVILYIIYTPISGAIALLMNPSIIALIGKDIFILIPAYISFLVYIFRQKLINPPIGISVLFILLTLLVILQSFNANVPNLLASIIGAKVWLFYIPITYLSYYMIKTSNNYIFLLRIILINAWIPCMIGIFQWLASSIYGYEYIMTEFYGDAASGATQAFTQFGDDVGGTFYRIPSTFTYVGQYFGFLLTMLVPASILMQIDSSHIWKNFSFLTFVLLIISSLMSGSRAAYLFFPLYIFLIIFISGSFTKLIKYSIFLTLLALVVLPYAGILPLEIFTLVFNLIFEYGETLVIQGFIEGFTDAPLGNGTGTNTGAARYAFDTPLEFSAFESYYAKSIYELGFLGLILIFSLFIYPIILYIKLKAKLNKNNKITAIALLAFFITITINSFKGWQLDMDPVNFYFWLYYGIFLKTVFSNPSSDKI